MVALAHRARRRLPISAPTGVGVFAMGRWAHRTHLAGLLFLLAACGAGGGQGRAAQSPGAIAVTDGAGRQVALAGPARRIVSLSPAVTELLFALGAGDRLVGRTTWCDYPPAVRQVPTVGDGLNPDLEAVVAARPDLVVLYRSALNESAADQLGRLGVAALLLTQDRLEDLARAARLLGRVTGRESVGDSVAGAIVRVLAAPAPGLGIRLALIAWDNPPMVIGGGSYLDQLATLAGARNVFHDLGSADVVSLETIAVRDPDVIVVLSDSAPAGPPAFARRPSWQVIRAVRQRRFVTLAGSLFGRPSPRAPAAIAAFRKMLEAAR
jgi:ABC-type Fe3+-hydroxamate transport system substrate-binding protein